MSYFHDHPISGHLGIAKTFHRLQTGVFWPGMQRDVKAYTKSCGVYQLVKSSQQKLSGLLVPIRAIYPWEYVGVDFVGPLPCTAQGNTHILVFVNYFTKWVEVSALREATTVADRFMDNIVAQHGAPKNLISDRSIPFVNAFFDTLLQSLGSEHCVPPPD